MCLLCSTFNPRIWELIGLLNRLRNLVAHSLTSENYAKRNEIVAMLRKGVGKETLEVDDTAQAHVLEWQR